MRYPHDPLNPNSLSGVGVGAVYEDHTGALWIGILGGGLDRFDRATGRFTHYAHDPNDPHSLGHDHVKALYEDHQGMLWVGTNQGLDRATGRFIHYVHDPDDPRFAMRSVSPPLRPAAPTSGRHATTLPASPGRSTRRWASASA